MLDNSKLIAPFMPEKDDGDTFLYTEMLDRSNKKGNNGHRLVKTFYHRSREEFWEQLPHIHRLCDLALARACTRLAPRSFKRVGKKFTELVVDAALTENWVGMKSLYNRACGIVSPNEKLWIFDVDIPCSQTDYMEVTLKELAVFRAKIPSKKGYHYIVNAFDIREFYLNNKSMFVTGAVQIHKDNPTNLYIPENAA